MRGKRPFKVSHFRKILGDDVETDPDRDRSETDPRPETGPDRTGFDPRSDGPEEDRVLSCIEEEA